MSKNMYHGHFRIFIIFVNILQAFSADGRSKTIETQPQFRSQEPEIGRVYSKELSFTDIATVNSMYQCSECASMKLYH